MGGREGLDQRARARWAGVADHDDLEVAPRLGGDRVERLEQAGTAVVVGDDDADARHRPLDQDRP
jgi:hypothetical protein